MLHDRFQIGDLTAVHVGRRFGDVPQRWCLVRADQFIVIFGKPELRALTRLSIAVLPQTIELILTRKSDAIIPSHRGQLSRNGKHAGIVKFEIGQQRAVVAADALGLVNEQSKARQLVFAEQAPRYYGRTFSQAVGIVVKTTAPGFDLALVSRECLADVGKNPIDVLPQIRPERFPVPSEQLIAQRRGCSGRARQCGQWLKECFVLRFVKRILGDQAYYLQSIQIVFMTGFDRGEGLGPL